MSLLYPNEAAREAHLAGGDSPVITEAVCSELGLYSLLPLKNSSLTSYFTKDPAVMAYRQATLGDMEALPPLRDTLKNLLPILFDIEELRRLDRDRGNNEAESYLYSITEIELYIRSVDTLFSGLSPICGELKSPAFQNLWEFVKDLTESEYYKNLNEELKKLSSHASEVHSVTIGVNLDSAYRPVDAGVISLNATTFKSGKILDKILRLSFKNDAMTCIAPLTPMAGGKTENMQEAMVSAFRGAMEDIFKSSVRGWRTIVGNYVLEKTDFLLKLLPEIEFVSQATDLTKRLSQKGYGLTPPCILPKEEKAFDAKGLYNPDVALRIDDTVVDNDLTLDAKGRIYILTGPNRGGKSVITCAMGQCQAMAQLGLSVPAKSCSLSPVDGIFTHFPEGAEDTIDKGRLGEECARLRDIFDKVTEDSLILLDESLSSTGAYEASYVAGEILVGFAIAGCRGIFSTHLHDLAASVEEINRRSHERGGVTIDTLVAGIEEGKRSFRIFRAKPDGKSYAKDIADKYGISLSHIEKHLNKEH